MDVVRGGRQRPKDQRKGSRLPAGPLVQAVDEWLRVRRVPLEQALRGDQCKALQRARHAGTIGLLVLDSFCDTFGWHPRELYGDAWDAAVLAGHSAKFDPWRGVDNIGDVAC